MSKKISRIWSLSCDEFKEIVESGLCVRDIVEKLGYSKTSGSMALKVKERIKKDNIDSSHLIGRNAKGSSNPRYSLNEILIKNSSYTNMACLKKRLIDANMLIYKCDLCSNTGVWNNETLTLQIDHINGDHCDNRLSNLRLLCPNCHSQTSTFSGRNVK